MTGKWNPSGIGLFTYRPASWLGATASLVTLVSIRPATATVVIGGREDLTITALELSGATATSGGPLSGRVNAQYRAHAVAVPGMIEGDSLVFDEPQLAVAPGQTVAFYEGDRVLGGAIISATR
jgi:tRNA-specific 2-thiouridylase